MPMKHLSEDEEDGTGFLRKCNLSTLIRSDDKALREKALLICKTLLKKATISLTSLFGSDDVESRDRYYLWQIRRL